jgi:hypothetical protein
MFGFCSHSALAEHHQSGPVNYSLKIKNMARYKSKYKNLKIVMKRTYRKEVGGENIVVPGVKIEFENSILDTDDKEVIKFLDSDPVCQKMQSNNVFHKISDKAMENAVKEEPVEEKPKATPKETGGKKKVGKKTDKPAY